MSKLRVMVTGGAGYIGSHTCLVLLEAGYDVVVIDNLCNSSEESLKRVQQITGRTLKFYPVDLLDADALDKVFDSNHVDAVIHFAGLKAVGESVAIPLRYYHNNITGTLHLCEAMVRHNVEKIVFSSSATVYGEPSKVPITENFPLSPTNPYGRTKLMIEGILRDIPSSSAGNRWGIALLRYFNPVGGHPSGLMGEDPNGIPNNLFPYVAQVAVGKRDALKIFGNDYPTVDGTGVRDYIHVMDLAEGHLKVLENGMSGPGIVTYNLGTGKGYSVLEIVDKFEKASGRNIPYEVIGRRPGDIATCYADPSKASMEIGWSATRGIAEMCADAWRWQSLNPDGY